MMKVFITVEEAMWITTDIEKIALCRTISHIPQIGSQMWIKLDELREKIIKLGIKACREVWEEWSYGKWREVRDLHFSKWEKELEEGIKNWETDEDFISFKEACFVREVIYDVEKENIIILLGKRKP
jgi:hypothetical protein